MLMTANSFSTVRLKYNPKKRVREQFFPGTIVSAELNADGVYEALAVIQIADAESQTLQLHDASGPVISVLELPYSFEPLEL